jgi:hypothetical protein
MGRTSANVALNVETENGAAVAGLDRGAFSFALVRFTTPSGLTPLAVASFDEAMPGIYVMELRHMKGATLDVGAHAIVVSISSTGGDKVVGRAILRLDV